VETLTRSVNSALLVVQETACDSGDMATVVPQVSSIGDPSTCDSSLQTTRTGGSTAVVSDLVGATQPGSPVNVSSADALLVHLSDERQTGIDQSKSASSNGRLEAREDHILNQSRVGYGVKVAPAPAQNLATHVGPRPPALQSQTQAHEPSRRANATTAEAARFVGRIGIPMVTLLIVSGFGLCLDLFVGPGRGTNKVLVMWILWPILAPLDYDRIIVPWYGIQLAYVGWTLLLHALVAAAGDSWPLGRADLDLLPEAHRYSYTSPLGLNALGLAGYSLSITFFEVLLAPVSMTLDS